MRFKIEEVLREKRKTVSIRVTDSGAVVLKVPCFFSRDDVEKILESHRKWIDKTVKRVLEQRNFRKSFVGGELFFFFGEEYPLVISDSVGKRIVLENGKLFLGSEFLSIGRELFVDFYKTELRKVISDKISFYSEIYNFKVNGFKITRAEKRWGSCSFKNSLSFSFRLGMAPLSVVEYVVVHELAHTLVKNHSKEFWRVVEKVLPDYIIRRRWLRDYGYRLII